MLWLLKEEEGGYKEDRARAALVDMVAAQQLFLVTNLGALA